MKNRNEGMAAEEKRLQRERRRETKKREAKQKARGEKERPERGGEKGRSILTVVNTRPNGIAAGSDQKSHK